MTQLPHINDVAAALPLAIADLVSTTAAGPGRAAAFGRARRQLGADYGQAGLMAWDRAMTARSVQ